MGHTHRVARFTAVGLAVLLLTAGVAWAGVAASSITIKLTQNGSGGTFSGRVKSARAKCLGGRKVTLFHKYNPNVGHTYTNKRGRWSISVSTLHSGYYKAKVASTRRCGGATSTQITFF